MTEMLPLTTSPLRVRLRVEDYLLLDSSGAFASYARTELIDGDVFFVNAQYRPHALAKMEMYDAIRDALQNIGSPLRPLVEASVAVSEHDVPDPDIVLTSEPKGQGLVPVASVALVMEISDSTLRRDTKLKTLVYARANVPEYWVIDVNARVVHQMWAPEDGIYTERRETPFGEQIDANTIPGLNISTATL